jgi:DNA-binding transcriptional LysR family regulator
VRTGAVDDATDLFATRLGTSVTGCWASPSYVKKHGAPQTPADLASHECILVGGSTHGGWRFQSGSREQVVEVTGRVRVDSFRVGRALAAEGVGIMRTSRIFADSQVASGELVPLLERYWPKVPLFAVHAGPSPAPPKVRAFIDLAREVIGNRLAAFA